MAHTVCWGLRQAAFTSAASAGSLHSFTVWVGCALTSGEGSAFQGNAIDAVAPAPHCCMLELVYNFIAECAFYQTV